MRRGLPQLVVLCAPTFSLSNHPVSQLSCVPTAACSVLALSGDGRFLLTAADRAIKVWDYSAQAGPGCQVCALGGRTASKKEGGGQSLRFPRACWGLTLHEVLLVSLQSGGQVFPAVPQWSLYCHTAALRCTSATQNLCGPWLSPPTSSSSLVWETPSFSGTFWRPLRSPLQEGKFLPSTCICQASLCTPSPHPTISLVTSAVSKALLGRPQPAKLVSGPTTLAGSMVMSGAGTVTAVGAQRCSFPGGPDAELVGREGLGTPPALPSPGPELSRAPSILRPVYKTTGGHGVRGQWASPAAGAHAIPGIPTLAGHLCQAPQGP